jgi:hypothetical protein
MDPLLLGYMKIVINSNISCSNPVSSSEIMAFVRVELMLSFYKVRNAIASLKYLFVILLICLLSFLLQVSPAMDFNEANTSNFPSATTVGMNNLARYMQVLKCLYANSNVPTKSSVWLCLPVHHQHNRRVAGAYYP